MRRRVFDIARDDTPVRPRTFDFAKINAALSGKPASKRRYGGATGQPCRPVIALGRADFAERIHWPGRLVGLLWQRRPVPLVPAQAGIQFFRFLALDPRFRG